MEHKWTLIYSGRTGVYTLTEHQLVGDQWYKLSETEWTYLDAPLEHIRKTNEERARRQG